jgi:hypothetical protein
MLKKITILAVMMMSLAAVIGSAEAMPLPPCWPCSSQLK